MSWATVLVLAAGCYAFKLLGQVVRLGGVAERAAVLLPAALLSAIVVVSTVGADRRLVADSRLAGIAVAVLLIWRRAPLVAVIVAAAAATALTRAVV